MTQGEIAYMLSNHLAWKDLRGDEFGSWSEEIVFLLEHALGRWYRNEKGVHPRIHQPAQSERHLRQFCGLLSSAENLRDLQHLGLGRLGCEVHYRYELT